MSRTRDDDPFSQEPRWRQLTATPLAPDGAPMRSTPAWWPRGADGATLDGALADAAARSTPVVGATRVIDGVEMVEATFLWRDDRRRCEGPCAEPSVLVHLNTLTDNHRDHVAPAIARRVPGTTWWAHHLLLPADAILGYRIVTASEPLPDDVGSRRADWKRVHAAGRPDVFNRARLCDGFGFVSSLWQGPRAILHPDWSLEETGVRQTSAGERGGYGVGLELGEAACEGFDAPGDPRRRVTLWPARREPVDGGQERRCGLLVLLDGEIWRGNDVVRRLGPRAACWDLLIIDSGDLSMRARDLGDPRRSRELLRRCLEIAARDGSRQWSPQRVVVAGQSLGGAAAADLAVHHPEVASRAIVQSGSFWLGSGDRGSGEGDLLTWLRRRADRGRRHGEEALGAAKAVTAEEPLAGRLVLQCGVHEGVLRHGARTAAALLRREGALVEYREERGGHDYAWWRHGLSWGLDAHERDLRLGQ